MNLLEAVGSTLLVELMNAGISFPRHAPCRAVS
jgi:hypothetical protein